jgi:2-amino-4-hydroxy-6-hydroxymethyldihydropteridine diphosphokinase
LSVFLGLGSNIGNREIHLEEALAKIYENEKICIDHLSSLYESEPWGEKDQDSFLNQVVEIKTHLEPRELLAGCQQIEKGMGKKQSFRWGPRIIDIDLLLYNNRIIEEKMLQIPHPRLTQRRFVLVPLVEIAPSVFIPGFGKTALQTLLSCRDPGSVVLYKKRSGNIRRIPK